MTIALYRIDDRLIHGQVVVGWGLPMGLKFIVLVDDDIRASEWEQQIYRMAVPNSVEVVFASVAEGAKCLQRWIDDKRRGILLTGSVEAMEALVEAGAPVPAVNVGGLHHREGRSQRLRYVFLSETEVDALQRLVDRGVQVTAQDLPHATAVPLREFL